MTDFVELSDDTFEDVMAAQKLALVDYVASWCGSCRLAAPMVKRVAGSLNLPLFKVDAEKNPIARSHAEVGALPTLALIRDGRIVGALSTTREEGLREFLAQHGVA